MEISYKTEPFTYATINNLLTKEENRTLYEMCEEACEPYTESINDLSFFILEKDKPILKKYGLPYCRHNGLIMNNVGVPLNSTMLRKYRDMQSLITERLKSKLITEIFPPLFNLSGDEYNWSNSLTITSHLKSHELLPHTDNPVELIDYGKKHNIPVSAGIYKGVIFITNDEEDYSDYGTRFYETEQRSSELEEVPFIGGNACLFKSCHNSWHGTEFPNGLPNRRYTITMEYYEELDIKKK